MHTLSLSPRTNARVLSDKTTRPPNSTSELVGNTCWLFVCHWTQRKNLAQTTDDKMYASERRTAVRTDLVLCVSLDARQTLAQTTDNKTYASKRRMDLVVCVSLDARQTLAQTTDDKMYASKRRTAVRMSKSSQLLYVLTGISCCGSAGERRPPVCDQTRGTSLVHVYIYIYIYIYIIVQTRTTKRNCDTVRGMWGFICFLLCSMAVQSVHGSAVCA